jgi:metallo-beta-lactamase class B
MNKNYCYNFHLLLVVMLLITPDVTYAQNRELAAADSLTKDPGFFMKSASRDRKWEEPAEPRKIVGPIYFVGTKGLSSFLITTPQGHVLLYTGMPSSGPMIEKSIRALGFKPEDIKILLTGHAHVDHVGGHAYLKKISGAKVYVLAAEKELMESGGKADFHYGNSPEFVFAPVKVDQVFYHGDSIRLGNITMKALHTPGHTKGCTTWTMNVVENGRVYRVVFPDGTSVNPGYRLTVNPSYPSILNDYKTTFTILEGLNPDIWLSGHTDFFKYEEKLDSKVPEGSNAFVDPKGYKAKIAEVKDNFEKWVKKENESGNR